MQSGEAEREGVVGVGARAECVGRGDDGAQGVGVIGEERGGLVDRLLVEGNPRQRPSVVQFSWRGRGGCGPRGVGGGPLAAGFSGEPVLGGAESSASPSGREARAAKLVGLLRPVWTRRRRSAAGSSWRGPRPYRLPRRPSRFLAPYTTGADHRPAQGPDFGHDHDFLNGPGG